MHGAVAQRLYIIHTMVNKIMLTIQTVNLFTAPACNSSKLKSAHIHACKRYISNRCHYLNSPLKYDEFIETLESFASNSTAVGIDGISYQMLNHLPDSWKQLLHAFYQKCWLNETLPSIWKQSVIISILKQDKPKLAIASYRAIALTSHAGKIMQKLILKQLLHYCEKREA